LEAAVNFYRDELGFTVVSLSNGNSTLRLPSSPTTAICLEAKESQKDFHHSGLVFHVTSITAAFVELSEQGCVVNNSFNEEKKSFLIFDPAMNLIEFQELPVV
jgi:catechol-2,3-dioxygenase